MFNRSLPVARPLTLTLSQRERAKNKSIHEHPAVDLDGFAGQIT